MSESLKSALEAKLARIKEAKEQSNNNARANDFMDGEMSSILFAIALIDEKVEEILERYLKKELKMSDTKYPAVKVKLVGRDGNAFAIIGACRRAAEREGVSDEEIEAFMEESMSGDYDHLLQTCMKWFDVS